MAITLSQKASNAQLEALASLLDGGYIRVYSGQRPASPDMPITQQVLLAELRFDRPAFSQPSGGVLKAGHIKSEKSVRATDKATWYRAYARDGTTPVCDGSVGADGADMLLSNTQLQQTAKFSVSDYQLRIANPVR